MSSEVAYFPEGMPSASEARGRARAVGVSSEQKEARPDGGAVTPTCTIKDAIPAGITDELLMEQIGQGIRDALSPLFQRHAPVVRSVAHRILRDEAEADDLVQEVFLFVFRKAALFDATQGTARSWIIQITYHRAIDRRRYLISRHFYSCQDIEPGCEPADRRREIRDWERSVEGVWGSKGAAELRFLLSAEQLETIELHFFEGHTLEEIAERTGQSLSNVRHHYYRGLEKLRRTEFGRRLQPK
jgi:RNA polymerase sigma-70 factor (ECF subfamily)